MTPFLRIFHLSCSNNDFDFLPSSISKTKAVKQAKSLDSTATLQPFIRKKILYNINEKYSIKTGADNYTVYLISLKNNKSWRV
jgi:hypothetical protein